MSSELLLEEFRQAWGHYRHLENGRSWALGFFFTIVLSSIGGIAAVFDSARSNPDVYLATHGLVFVVGLLAVTIYLRVRKTAMVLRHYARVWREVRRLVYQAQFSEVNAKLDVFENPAVTEFAAGETATTHWLLLGTIGVCIFYLLLGALGGWPNLALPGGRRIVVFALLLLLVTITAIASLQVRRAEAREHDFVQGWLPKKPSQQTSNGQASVE